MLSMSDCECALRSRSGEVGPLRPRFRAEPRAREIVRGAIAKKSANSSLPGGAARGVARERATGAGEVYRDDSGVIESARGDRC